MENGNTVAVVNRAIVCRGHRGFSILARHQDPFRLFIHAASQVAIAPFLRCLSS